MLNWISKQRINSFELKIIKKGLNNKKNKNINLYFKLNDKKIVKDLEVHKGKSEKGPILIIILEKKQLLVYPKI